MGRPKSDQCSNGHFWTMENTRWIFPKSGAPFRICRICLRARKAAYGARQSVPHSTDTAPMVVVLDDAPRRADRNTFDLWTAIHPEPQPDDAPRLRLMGPFGGMGAR